MHVRPAWQHQGRCYALAVVNVCASRAIPWHCDAIRMPLRLWQAHNAENYRYDIGRLCNLHAWIHMLYFDLCDVLANNKFLGT